MGGRAVVPVHPLGVRILPLDGPVSSACVITAVGDIQTAVVIPVRVVAFDVLELEIIS